MTVLSARPRAGAVIVALALVISTALSALFAAPAKADTTDPFQPVFSTNTHGSILIAANTLMTCATACDLGGGAGTNVKNNDYTGTFVNVASSQGTFNSSTARLSIPTGGEVMYAALVWGGRATGTASPNNTNDTARKSAWLKVDSTSGTSRAGGAISATHFADSSATKQGYQSFLDVTDIVRAAGSGDYTVGNVQSESGKTNDFAGWALVVAVADPSAPMRNLTVFRGFSEISSAFPSVSFGVSGFLTPPSGTVVTTMGAVTYEGDRGSVGDQFTLNSRALTDGLNPSNDVFNSTFSDRGTRVTAGQNPDYGNQFGFDADLFTADGYLSNGATSATLAATSSGDQYWIGMITFATDLYEPNVHGQKSFTWTDVDHDTKLSLGDVVSYSVIVQNTGLDDASDTVFFDAIPTGTAYRPGSISIDGAPLTDAADGDRGTFFPPLDDSRGHVSVDVGAVAKMVDNSPTYTVSFDVTVTDAVPGQEIVNIAQVTSLGQTTRTVTGAVTNTTLSLMPDGGAGVPTVRDHSVVMTPTNAAPSTTIDVLVGSSEPGLTIRGVTEAAHGTLSVVGGKVVYTPEPGFAGRDAFVYTVEDADHNVTSGAVVVEVLNAAPIAGDDAIDLDVDVPAGTAVPVSVLGNDTDANDDALRVRGVKVSGVVQTSGTFPTSNGGSVTITGGVLTYTKPATFPVGATDSFTYVVEDSRGGSDEATVTITSKQINTAPAAVDDAGTAVVGGSAVTIAVLANDTDLDAGDTLSVTTFTLPSRGSVARSGNQLVYTPPATGAGGDVTFTYTVRDAAGLTDVATVTITLDAPPVAVDDSATTSSGTAVTVDVLANDSDLDSDPLTVTAVTVTPQGGRSVGSAVVVTGDDGDEVRFTPATGFVGDATVQYTVSDGHGGTTTGTLTVTVDNAAPVAAPDTASTTVGVAVSGIDVLANDTDTNVTAGFGGQSLTIVTTGADAPTADHGTVTVVGGTLTVTPEAGYVGDVVVTYTVSDGAGGTATGTLTVTVTNTDPVAVPDTATTATSHAVTIDVLANDTDGDDEPLTVEPGSLTQPRDASHTVRGTAAVVGGKVVYTPPTGWTGTVTFDYAATDGHTTSTATVTVTVDNAPPTATSTKATTPSGKPVTVDVLASASDANAAFQQLTVVGAHADHGAKVVANPDGTLTVTPVPGFVGPVTVTYDVSDGLATTTTTLVVTVLNAPPAPAVDAAVTTPGRAVRIPVLANDTDDNGEDLRVVAVGTPRDAAGKVRGTVVVDDDGALTYTPPAGFSGVVRFAYTVTDGTDTTTEDVTVAVGEPAVPADGRATTRSDRVIVVDVTGDDETLTAVTPPAHGAAEIVDGRLVYTPEPGFVGEVAVDYEVLGQDGRTLTRTVTIVVTGIDDGKGEATPAPTPDPTPGLAVTGASPAPLLALAGALLAAGAVLTLVVRRRRA